METTGCALCGVDDGELLFPGRDRLLGGSETFTLRRCRRCGLIYLNPRPTLAEMNKYYPSHYACFVHEEQKVNWYHRLRYRVFAAKRCRIARGGQKPGRLLDIGCGDGLFMQGMEEQGWEVHGLDISPVAVQLARDKGLEVFEGELGQAGYAEESFDLITMWDVLEHLHDPGAHLAQVARLLKAGGSSVVTIPNPHSLDFRLFGPVWTGLDVPRHLYVYTRPALLQLFERAGLEVISGRCISGGQWVSTRSLEWWIDEQITQPNLKRWLKRLIHSQVWYWLLRPFYFGIDLLNLGSSITYRCQAMGQPDP